MLKVRANPLFSAEVSESASPIPLTHDSNSSDDFKEVGLSNLLEVEDDYYKMLLKDCAKDWGETNESKSDDENNSKENDGYDRYGGYN
ncbi:hypothetical protein GLOIN_2v1886109 [Rhizophagus clarus]|uniref:Uncharacterized protein n=1 Tax=Rhizophagus clarus TaxID=94130 RepID=A0A8H3MJG0_9GLOM|nr:hypothetical protein GLOIN_2v1886109 [Rhizophagus clarus]